MRIMKNLLLGIIILYSGTILAQDDQYIVTVQNDTIRGKVVMSKYSDMIQQVAVKADKKRVTYKSYQVKAVKNRNGVHHTLKIQKQYQFAQLVKEGYLSYYVYSGNSASRTLAFDTPLLYKSTTEYKEVPNISFKKQIGAFLSDCKTTKTKFEAGEYGRNDLEKIVDDYNECISGQTDLFTQQQVDTKKKITKADKVGEIRAAVSKSTKIKNVDELIEMLTDVASKLKTGDAIPGYLLSALKEELTNEPELAAKLLKIIE